MAEGRRHIEKALRGCAEAGVPENVDLWPGIGDRVAAPERTSGRRSRLVPHTRAGWAFVALLAVFFGMGAYGASGWAYNLFQYELPGADAKVLGKKVDQKLTIDGATVNVEWAYADAEFVVVGFSVEDGKRERGGDGPRMDLQPLFLDEVGSNRAALPPERGDLTDENGGDFDLINGTTMVDDEGWWPWPLANTAVFSTPEGFEPGENHQFDFTVYLGEPFMFPAGGEADGGGSVDERMPVGPFEFSFEVPVRPAPTTDLNQKVEANGVVATLDQVVNSPARPQAVVCFRPLDEGSEWMPLVKTEPASREPITPQPLGNGCWSAPLYDSKESRSSITVTEVSGVSEEYGPNSPGGMKTLQGPWTFDFEVPKQ